MSRGTNNLFVPRGNKYFSHTGGRGNKCFSHTGGGQTFFVGGGGGYDDADEEIDVKFERSKLSC